MHRVQDESPCAGDDASSIISAARASSAGSMFQFLPDGSRVFRVRVDVHDFAPEDLSVRISDGQLVVSAERSVNSADGRRRHQLMKSVDVPDDVHTDQLVSRLSYDGVLTVEAPANPPSYQAVIESRDKDHTRSRARPARRDDNDRRVHVDTHTTTQPSTARNDHQLHYDSHVINTG